jgi:hypothetical protein
MEIKKEAQSHQLQIIRIKNRLSLQWDSAQSAGALDSPGASTLACTPGKTEITDISVSCFSDAKTGLSVISVDAHTSIREDMQGVRLACGALR